MNVLKWLVVGYVVIAILAWIAGMYWLIRFGETDAEHVARIGWYAMAWPVYWIPAIVWPFLER